MTIINNKSVQKTSTAALCILTGIPPLNLQVKATATSVRILRLGIPTENYDPTHYESKTNTYHVKPYKDYLNILEEGDTDKAEVQIYTDGSKLDHNTGYAYCVLKKIIIIEEEQTQLRSENTVYQAELLAIEL